MKNLNKKNFWDNLYKEYPLGVKLFCNWIDGYKERNDWKELFGEIIIDVRASRCTSAYIKSPAPKFHNLPLAMQIGILIEFIALYPSVHEWEIEDLTNHDWRRTITEFFKMLHEQEDCRQAFYDTLKDQGLLDIKHSK